MVPGSRRFVEIIRDRLLEKVVGAKSLHIETTQQESHIEVK